MSLSIDDLFAPQTSDQIRGQIIANLVSLGVPADKWNKGGVASTIVTVLSMALALFSVIIATIIQGFFLPTATGASLKLLAKYMYGVDVPDATFASGNVTLTNTGGASYTKQPGEFTCLNPTTKVSYTNDAVLTIGPLGTATVHVVANVAGSAGNAVTGAITDLVTNLLGVTITNAAALVGSDAPTDASIRTLCLNSLGARSVRGVRTAYAYAVQVAKNAVTQAPVNINRWAISSSSTTGIVTTIVASPSGAADANDVTGIATSIEAIARPEAVTANVSSATEVAYTHAITLWAKVPDGVTAAQVKTQVDTDLITFLRAYDIGGISANDDANPTTPIRGLFASGVYGQIAESVASLGGRMVSAQGAADLAMTSAQVATNGITTTVRLIVPTAGTTVV